jgi:hypothetical protein
MEKIQYKYNYIIGQIIQIIKIMKIVLFVNIWKNNKKVHSVTIILCHPKCNNLWYKAMIIKI